MNISKLQQLRRKNLNAKIEAMGGQAEFVNRTGMNQGQLSLLQNGGKNIGEKLARSIETKARWPSGSLDAEGPTDALDQIEAALNNAHWLGAEEKANFVALFRSMRDRKAP